MRYAITILLLLFAAVLPVRAQDATFTVKEFHSGWRINIVSAPEAGLQFVAGGLAAPVALAPPPDGSGRLFVVDQAGLIRIIGADGALRDEPFLDVRDRMVTLQQGFDERGLLGLAFHPEYADNGRFFVYYSAPLRDGAPSGWNNTSHISEFMVSGDDAQRADPQSERILLQVDQPQGNHNAGTVAFGPDGYLYISLGDGGGGNDTGTGHLEDWYTVNTGGNAQNVTETLLGKILRIDVNGGDPYGIPAENPFVGRDGLDEIYAYGLRNPYRFSFDTETGELFAGDAGQRRWEEVSIVTRGANMGWNVKEGTHCFNTDDPTQDRPSCPDVVGSGHPDAGAPLVDPIIEYPNANQTGGLGAVVVGGYVYRGTALPEFAGRYVFGDWSRSSATPAGQVFITTSRPETGLWSFENVQFDGGSDLEGYLLGFGQDPAGEIYVLTSQSTAPAGTSGAVFRLVPQGIIESSEFEDELPSRTLLHQNYPNPFNPTTTIAFHLERSEQVTLTVFDVMGRKVATLVDGVMSAGSHAATWDGAAENGGRVASGQFLYRLTTGTGVETRVMTLLK